MSFDINKRIGQARRRMEERANARFVAAQAAFEAERAANQRWLDERFTHLRRSLAMELSWARRKFLKGHP